MVILLIQKCEYICRIFPSLMFLISKILLLHWSPMCLLVSNLLYLFCILFALLHPTFKHITIFKLYFLKFPSLWGTSMDLLYVQYQSLYNMNERKLTIMLNICNEKSFLTCAGFAYFKIWLNVTLCGTE